MQVRVMVEFGTSSAFRGWVRVRVLGYGFGVRGRKVKSRDCALASDLVRAVQDILQITIYFFRTHTFNTWEYLRGFTGLRGSSLRFPPNNKAWGPQASAVEVVLVCRAHPPAILNRGGSTTSMRV